MRHTPDLISRRTFLRGAVVLVAAAAGARTVFAQAVTGDHADALDTPANTQPYRIGASDWMLLKRQKPGAMQLARDCGLDGVELDMGPLGRRPTFDNQLREAEFRDAYLQGAQKLGLEICSLAMSAFYGQPFADHPRAAEFAEEWIDLMPVVGTRVGFLPLISKEDLTRDAEARQKVVSLFQRITPRAERAGVVLGLNTQLDAGENRRLLDDVGSSTVRITYNIGEAVDAGRDPLAEISALGSDRVIQIIPTLSDGQWLENDRRLDVPKLKQLLDEIRWSGWLVLQRSRMQGKSVTENFSANARYLKSVFQAG